MRFRSPCTHFFAILLLLLCYHSHASSPGKKEGPPGNWWKAEVIGVSVKPQGLKVKLKEMIGGCMYESHEGTASQVVFIPTENFKSYKVGQSIEIWVHPDAKGSLVHPKCL